VKTITEAYPPLPIPELLSEIESFKKANLDEKQRIVKRLVSLHPIINMDYGPGSTFFRARKILANEYHESVQDLLWNPQKISVGRLNNESSSVLYLADRQETAFKETGIEKDLAIVGAFKVREGCRCRVTPIGELIKIQRTGRGFLAGDASSEISKKFNACDMRELKSLLIADLFLFECLTSDEYPYHISSFIASCVFDKNPNIDAIAYPSAKQFSALNFAVKADRFWKAWSIVSARRMFVDELAYGLYETSRTEHVNAITQNGNLVWDRAGYEDLYIRPLSPAWHKR